MSKFLASFVPYKLIFKKPAGTSRGYLLEKPSWYLTIKEKSNGDTGIGECAIIPGLSIDNMTGYEEKLKEICTHINLNGIDNLSIFSLEGFPSIRSGLEMALLDLENRGVGLFYENDFSNGKIGIPINGLVWMGDIEDMLLQVHSKVEAGYNVIKLKIGALNFDSEIKLLGKIREYYPDIILRLDANGAFSVSEALGKLEILSKYNIHSIEQPIKAGQWDEMKSLCLSSPIPIALDEELIGVSDIDKKMELLDSINPTYIILKPSLLGGFAASDEWIKLAEERNIGWWTTSALESNVGLNAIAQWAAEHIFSKEKLFQPLLQGLGTGALYTNNVGEGLNIREGILFKG